MDSHKEQLIQKVLAYLRFADEHAALATAIAEHAAAQIMREERERGGRIARLSPERLIELQVRACIRHTHTGYDDILVETTLEQADILRGATEAAGPQQEVDDVTAFIEQHRRQ
jgi:hypothetical protein